MTHEVQTFEVFAWTTVLVLAVMAVWPSAEEPEGPSPMDQERDPYRWKF